MPTSLYSKDEKVLCFHQELLYDAKILEVRHQDPNDRKSDFEYLVHYKGWKNTWDDWVLEERLRKATEENRELAAHLKRNVEASIRSKQTKSSSKKRAMSDRSSVRDSEERGSSVARGSKRARGDNDIQTSTLITVIIMPDEEMPFDPYDTSDMSDLSDPPSSSDSELSDPPSDLASDVPGSSVSPTPRASNKTHDDDAYQKRKQEDEFYAAPTIHFVLTDNLKALLVDDWERVTKNYSVVNLPAPKPVRKILQDWHDDDLPKRTRRLDRDVLKTVMNGLMEYFDVALEKVLLYRYERPQFRHFYKLYGHIEGNGPVDIYGAEHLLRLFSCMGDHLAETNLTVERSRVWRREIAKLALWLSRNSEKYFRTEYIAVEDSYGGDKRHLSSR